MNAKERRLEESGRGQVRYVYLIEEWPEGADLEHIDAFLQAPEAAVIQAVKRDRDHYGKLLDEERARRVAAEQTLAALEDAVRRVLALAQSADPVAVAQLELFGVGA